MNNWGGIRSRLQEEADALGLDALDADALAEAEEGLDTAGVTLLEWQQLEARLSQAGERLERQMLRREEAQQAVQDAQATLEGEEKAWQAWLQQRGLLSTFSTDSIQELRTLVNLARTHRREVDAMQRRIAAIQTDIDEFIGMARPLAEAHGFEVEWIDYAKVAGLADDIIDLHRDVSEAARTCADAQKELEESQQELAARQNSQQDVADEMVALLKSGGTQDVDDFRTRNQIFQERAGLTTTIAGAVEQMQRISGPGDALEALRATLAATDIQTIRDGVWLFEADLEEYSCPAICIGHRARFHPDDA